MAGESPDNSVRQGSSGATDSAEERDPRLSVFREPEHKPAAERESAPERDSAPAVERERESEAAPKPAAAESGREPAAKSAAKPAAERDSATAPTAPAERESAPKAGSAPKGASAPESGAEPEPKSKSGAAAADSGAEAATAPETASGAGVASAPASAPESAPEAPSGAGSDAVRPSPAPDRDKAQGKTQGEAADAARGRTGGVAGAKAAAGGAAEGESGATGSAVTPSKGPDAGGERASESAPDAAGGSGPVDWFAVRRPAAKSAPEAADASAANAGPDDSGSDSASRANAKTADPRVGAPRSAAVGPGGDLRAAVAAWVATADDTEGADDAAAADRAPAKDATDAGDAGDATTVFRAVKPGSGQPAGTAAGKTGGETGKQSAGQSAGQAEPAAPVDQTTVLKAITPKTPRPPRNDETTVLKAVTPKTGPAARDGFVDQPTTAFRAPKVDGPQSGGPQTGGPKGAAAASEGPADRQTDQPTAVFRMPKAAGAAGAPSVPKPTAGDESDSERTSTFVPLRKDENPRTPPAKPVTPYRQGTPAAPATPASPAPATPKPGAAGGMGAGPAARAAKPGGPGAPGAPAGPVVHGAKPAPAAPAVSGAPGAPVFGEVERTRQQPLPPKPPLDMLAELTNNPPPAPTAIRTTVRRFKIWTPLVILVGVVFAVVQMVRPLPDPKLTMTASPSYTFAGAKPSLTMPTEGQAWMAASGLGTVDTYGEQKPIPIASVTKSMTAYIILRDHPFKRGEKGKTIEIDKTAELEGQKDKTDNESTLNTVVEGNKISEYDAIAALMIPSANNIARLLARWDSGSQEAFVKKMNDTARELGMTNTTYTDPSGLDATTVSTAEDQVKLGLKLIEIQVLRDITKLPEWKDPSGKTWPNWNTLVPFDNALGIKTGSTTAAGGNLLFAAHKIVGKTDQFIVGAVLGQHATPILGTAIDASKKMMLETQDALTGAKVIKKGDVVGYVDDGLGGKTPVVATADVAAVGWASLKIDVKLGDGAAATGRKIPHTAKAGTEIGTLTVGSGVSQVKVPVALRSDLAEPGFGSKLTRVG